MQAALGLSQYAECCRNYGGLNSTYILFWTEDDWNTSWRVRALRRLVSCLAASHVRYFDTNRVDAASVKGFRLRDLPADETVVETSDMAAMKARGEGAACSLRELFARQVTRDSAVPCDGMPGHCSRSSLTAPHHRPRPSGLLPLDSLPRSIDLCACRKHRRCPVRKARLPPYHPSLLAAPELSPCGDLPSRDLTDASSCRAPALCRCDNCVNPKSDVGAEARLLLEVVRETGEKFGAGAPKRTAP